MDRAKVRRNRPTVNRLWGDAVAILAGDFLLASVMDLALRIRHVPVLPLAVETLIQLVEGQMVELQNQGNLTLTERTSMWITEKKTASLFAMACRLGGLLSGGPSEMVLSLEYYGLQLGTAFQLLDDIQDYMSSQRHTGKEPGRDLAEGKVTLPVLAAFKQADTRDKKRMRQIFSDPERLKCLRELTDLVETLGGFSYTFRIAQNCVKRAVSRLRDLPAGEQRLHMEDAAWTMLREKGSSEPGNRAGT
jgi:octaprenyl-diphosphate synthase